MAAFMGWGPDDYNHRLGPRFAREIRPGDTILIARRHNYEPEIVGLGTVVGRYKTRLNGFKPPESFGSLRQLKPFVPMSRTPDNLPFMQALNQTAALHQLHPDKNPSHEVLCRWMDGQLAISRTVSQKKPRQGPAPGVQLSALPKDKQLEYQTRTRGAVRQARKKEAELVARYRDWIGRQDRKLQIFKTHEIQCDAYEEARKNLIEAKCSARRQYVRMAVGQLLDYAFQARNQLGTCHNAILVPSKPDDSLLTWLNSIGISAIWEERSAFLDNANGRFT
jgi:hypothetical protein